MVNQETIDLIKSFEQFKAKTYVDPVGVLTIGYGTTAMAGIGVVPKMGMVISKADAERYLALTIEKFGNEIKRGIKAPINENEFGAFVSLAYNIGPPNFLGSTALRKFNAGDKSGSANAILFWNKGTIKGKKVVLNGLVRRRGDERALFLKPVGAAADPIETTPKNDDAVLTTEVGKEVGSVFDQVIAAIKAIFAWLAR